MTSSAEHPCRPGLSPLWMRRCGGWKPLWGRLGAVVGVDMQPVSSPSVGDMPESLLSSGVLGAEPSPVSRYTFSEMGYAVATMATLGLQGCG